MRIDLALLKVYFVGQSSEVEKGYIQRMDKLGEKLDVIAEIVRRIARVASPEKIILFGSVARGEDDGSSDIDLLVIKQCAVRRELAGKIYQALIGVGRAVDVVVATPDDVQRYRESPSMVISPALKEGKVIYAA